MRSRIACARWLAAVALACAPGAALAVTIDLQIGNQSYDLTALGTGTPVGDLTVWSLNDQTTGEGLWSDPNGLVRIDGWNTVLKEDPYVFNNLVVTNISSSTQTFTATVTLPIPGGFGYGQIIDSSVGITVTDSISSLDGTSPDGASLSSVGPDGIYSGQINGSTALTLFPHPATLSCTSNGCSVALSDPVSGNFDGPAGPGTATSIAIVLHFDLGPGDSAGITSRFEIVPEPATLALVGGGLVALATLRRRTR